LRSIRDETTAIATPMSATIAATPIVKMISPIMLHFNAPSGGSVRFV
jgi:hypothetical protein